AHLSLGMTEYNLGEFTSARTHLEQGLALYDPQMHARYTSTTADPRVVALSFASLALCYLGYPDQGLQKSQELLALATDLSHPFSLAFASHYIAECHLLCREEQLARERAEAMITLSTEQGFPLFLVTGTLIRGAALAQQGQGEEGITQLHQGLTAQQTMG